MLMLIMTFRCDVGDAKNVIVTMYVMYVREGAVTMMDILGGRNIVVRTCVHQSLNWVVCNVTIVVNDGHNFFS